MKKSENRNDKYFLHTKFATRKEPILSGLQLKRLAEHKYSCESRSLLDPWLQPWWNWLVTKTPLWLAPNLITIIGLILNVATTLLLISYSPNGTTSPPRWASFLCGLGLFIYQTLDSIDGKQARRTNTQSPLGELFDHGCDSISTVFVALSACISCQLGKNPNWMFFQCFCAIALFYCAHWQTYVSGTLRFGKIDVTEAQFSIIAIHLITSLFGSEIWHIQIIGSYEVWFIIAIATFIGGYFSLKALCSVILSGGVGKNGSTVAGTSVLSPSIPLTLVIIPAIMIAQKSPSNVFHQNAGLYVLAFGMVAAKVTNKLVIAHMSRSAIEYLDWAMLGPCLMFLNQYFNCIFPEIWLLWFTLIWGTQDLLRYCAAICLEICNHLQISLFKIPHPPRVAASYNPVSEKNGGNIAVHRKSSSRQMSSKIGKH